MINLFIYKKSFKPFISAGLISLILGITAFTYNQLGEPKMLFSRSLSTSAVNSVITHPPITKINESIKPISPLASIQAKIKTDKQNSDLWFVLGNEYMASREFKNAALVYHYADRLSNKPQANIFAAQATARYYANHQHIDLQAQEWIDQAFALDPNNVSALMLIASDHFLLAQYQLAIDSWVKILDANLPGTDRAAIIRSINQTTAMI